MNWDLAKRVSLEYSIERLEQREMVVVDEADRQMIREELREKKSNYKRLYGVTR